MAMERIKNVEQDNNPFLHGKILPAFIRFSVPLMLSLVLQALYGTVDLMVVGHFGTAASVSAVATGSQVTYALTAIIIGLATGGTITLGQAVGAGDKQQISDVLAGQIKLYIVTTIVMTVVMLFMARQTVAILNVVPEAFPQTVAYIMICCGGMVFISAYNAISGIFRGIGNSKSPLLFVLIACISNLVLDVLFVGAFHLDAAGAALATVLSQAISVFFSLRYIHKNKLPISLKRSSLNRKHTIGPIVKIGGPIALQSFLVSVSFLIITSIINRLGVVASASVGISEKLFSIFSIVPMAFMSALGAFVAQNEGAGQRKRAKKTVNTAMLISFCFGTLVFFLSFFGGRISGDALYG